MNNDAVITFENVTKRFPVQMDRTAKEIIPSLLKGKSWAQYYTVFSNLSFSIKKGETVGIVGRNGAGKSTALKLIAGVTYPTQGKVEVRGQVAPLIELGAGFHHELTGLENIFLNGAIIGMSKKEIAQRVDAIIDFSELHEFMHTPVKRYSTGMMMRLAFAIAVQTTAPIILIDEVLAVGDVAFQRKCLNKLNRLREERDKTIIFVSHSEKQVKEFCERAILLEHGSILLDGEPKTVFRQYNHLMKSQTDDLPS